MMLSDRLRALAEALPSEGSSVTFTRGDLLALVEGAETAPVDSRDMSVEDVATETQRASSTVRTWLLSGQLHGYKLRGKAWRVPRSALRAFLDAQAAPPVPPADPAGVDISAWRRVAGNAR